MPLKGVEIKTKKKKKYDLGSLSPKRGELVTEEVPEMGKPYGWAGGLITVDPMADPSGLGLLRQGTARYVGGPLSRAFQIPQQVKWAYDAAALGRPQKDWHWYIPYAAVIYPGKYGRIQSETVTNTDNVLVNLANTFFNDPINFFPANGLTKVGKAKNVLKAVAFLDDAKALKLAEKAVKGIENTFAAQKLYEGLDTERLLQPITRQEAVIDWLRKSDPKMLNRKLSAIGTTRKDFKDLKPLLDNVRTAPEGTDLLKTSWWLSEELMNNERTLIGVDPLMGGWTGNARWGIPKSWQTQPAKLVAGIEKGWANVNKSVGIRQIGKEATIYQKVPRAVGEEEILEAKSKVNTLNRIAENVDEEIRVNQEGLKTVRKPSIRKFIVENAEKKAASEIDAMKMARDTEIKPIHEDLRTVQKAERAGVLQNDTRIKDTHYKLEDIKILQQELGKEYELTGALSNNRIRKMVKAINLHTADSIKDLENTAETEREFLFALRKTASETSVNLKDYSTEIAQAEEVLTKYEVPADKNIIIKYLLSDEANKTGARPGKALTDEDFKLAEAINMNAEKREIEKLIGDMPLSRELKNDTLARYQQLKAVGKQTQIVKRLDNKVKGMQSLLRETEKVDTGYYRELVKNVPRLLNLSDRSFANTSEQFDRLWKLHQGTRKFNVNNYQGYVDTVQSLRGEYNMRSAGHSFDIAKRRSELQKGVTELKNSINPRKIGKTLRELNATRAMTTVQLEEAKNSLSSLGYSTELVKRNDMLFMMERYKKMATSMKLRELANKTEDISVIRAKVEEITDNSPTIAKTIVRGLEDERENASNFYLPEEWDIIQALRSHNDAYYYGENRFREYTYLKNYLLRKVAKNDKGDALLGDLTMMHVEPLKARLKAWGKDTGFLDILGSNRNELLKASNESQFSRSRGASQKVSEATDNLRKIKAEFIANKEFEKAQELIPAINFLEHYKQAYNIKVTHGPMRFNDEYSRIFETEIKDFYRTKTGQSWGFKPNDPPENFRVFEENIWKIMGERTVRFAEAYSTGTTIENFSKAFFYDEAKDANLIAAIKETGSTNLVNVKETLRKYLAGSSYTRISNKTIEEIAGKVIENKVGSEDAVKSFADMMIGWMRVVKTPAEKLAAKYYDDYTRFWSNSVLYGGRTTNVQQDFIGDRWQQFLDNVGMNNILPTPKLINGYLTENSKFLGYKGYKNNGVAVNNGRAKYTFGEMRQLFNELEAQKGVHNSELVGMTEVFGKSPHKEVRGLANVMNIEDLKRGRTIPAIYRVRAFNEQLGRFGTFWDSLEKGMSPIEGYERVQKIHFDYSRMNDWARRVAPFYYWHFRNIPRQFKMFFEKPAKQMLPFKLIERYRTEQEKREGYNAPLRSEIPEYLEGQGVRFGDGGNGYEVGTVEGRDIWFDPNMLPPVAAMQMTGIMNNPSSGMDIFEEVLRNSSSSLHPWIQVVAEEFANKQLFNNMAISSQGFGAGYESGIKTFAGMDIEGKPFLQRTAHVVGSLVPQTEIFDQALKAFRDFPAALASVKVVGGIPIRLSDRDKEAFKRIGKRKGELEGNRHRITREKDRADARGDMKMSLRLDEQLTRIQDELDTLNEEFSERSTVLGEKAADQYEKELERIRNRHSRR